MDGGRGHARIGGVSAEGGQTGGTRQSSIDKTMSFSFSFSHVSCTVNAVEIEGLLEVACIRRSIFGCSFFVIVVCFVIFSDFVFNC